MRKEGKGRLPEKTVKSAGTALNQFDMIPGKGAYSIETVFLSV